MSRKKAVKKVTLIEVAKDAGVSRATASLVLRNSDLVADATRERVLASISRLGYVYNRTAAALRSQRSQTIGLVITDITNPFFAELAVGIESELEQGGFSLLMSNTFDQVNKQERLLRTMNSRQVDGVLLCPAEGTSVTALEQMYIWGLPHVLIARHVEGSSADYIGADNALGAMIGVNHLIQQGHRQIAFLGGVKNSSARRERLAGVQSALNRHRIKWNEGYEVSCPVSREGGYKAMLELLDLENPPTAALCYNDVIAFGAIHGLQSKGIQPGSDFGLIGFDDVEDAALIRPALTTISIKAKDIGRKAVQLLLRRVESPNALKEHRILPPSLAIRDTTRAIL